MLITGYKRYEGKIDWLSDEGQSKLWYFNAITKTYLYNFDPLKPHFYIVKLGFTGVYIIFLISAQNIDCGYSLEPYLYNFDPLKPHFYIVKLGFTGVYIIFLISAQNIDFWYSLEPPRWGGSNEYPQSMFWAEIWKLSEFFIWKFSFFGGKIFSIFE